MAVVQRNKSKVRPVMGYRELNQFVSSHTANCDVCSSKLRSWRKLGENLEIIDLKKAYLQIRIDEALWKYQVVEYEGRQYCLIRLSFGLNVAPRVR